MNLTEFLLISILGWCYVVTHVYGYCTFTIPQDESKKPKLYTKIGSRKTPLRTDEISFRIQGNDVISMACDTHPDQATGSIDLKCIGTDLYVDTLKLHSQPQFSCYPIEWTLYESSKQFDWCPTPMASYLLARPVNETVFEYLAGVCYNTEQQQIQNLYYAEAHQLSKHKYPSRLENYYPSAEIKDILQKYVPRRIYSSYFNNVEIRYWLQFSQYENHSLILDPYLYRNVFHKFGGLLELDWWPNLRSGNWRLYEQALREYIEADGVVYDILAGVSGSITVPHYENASHENYTMIDVTYWNNQKIPLYVWHCLKSPKGNGRDFVVIGVNSAFSDFYREKDLIFCPDICHKIDWLETVQITFSYKTMGLIFCCDAEEVKLSKSLDEFPLPSTPDKDVA